MHNKRPVTHVPRLPARKARALRGQALTEFTIILAMMMFVVLAMVLFLAVFGEYSGRILTLIGLEYP